MPETEEQFIKRLVKENPSLEPVYTEHSKDYDGLLPHVFIADVARYCIANFERDKTPTSKILDFLNRAYYYGSNEVNELVAVSFFEHHGIDELIELPVGIAP